MDQSGPAFVGWRLWRLQDARLFSWAIDIAWRPGVNQAACLRGDHTARCPRSPGSGCMCGFWALRDPFRCVRKGRGEWINLPGRACPVMGLMRGWGETAIHSEEGFRAQYAQILCLFDHAMWDPDLDQLALMGSSWWQRWRGRLGRGIRAQVPPASSPRAAADAYGVPLVRLRDALRVGVLRELGVAPDALRRLEAGLHAGPSSSSSSHDSEVRHDG